MGDFGSFRDGFAAPLHRGVRIVLQFAALCMIALPASAAPPPVRENIDKNQVDLFRGSFAADETVMTIGQDQGIAVTQHWRGSGWTGNMWPMIYKSGTTLTVTINGVTDRFIQSGSVYTPTEGRGTSLTSSGGAYTYQARDGTVVSFSAYPANSSNYKPYGEALASSLVRPNGQRLDYTYQAAIVCEYYEGDFCTGGFRQVRRLASIKGAFGYMVNFSYESDDPETDGLIPWMTSVDQKMINLANDYCAPATTGCSTTQNMPSASNPNAPRLSYVQTGGNITGIRRPGSTTNDVTIAYSGGRVSSVSDRSGTTTYTHSDLGGVRTVNVTNAVGATTVYKFDIALERMTSVTDPIGNTTSFGYDSNGRLNQTIYPEGNQLVLTYDARGNVLTRRKIAKPGSGLADLLATASFPATCTNTATCNQPTSSTDEKGFSTDYSYDPTHGGLLSVTLPAPGAGAVRPQIRYGYSTLQAQIKNSSNGIVGSGQNVVMLTSISQCRTTASCAGTADEQVETITYGSAGVANNLLPTAITRRTGDSSVVQTTSLTYDILGNLVSVDGPLPGNADTSSFLYDLLRRRVGEIGPDPDGAGPRPRVARRSTYNSAHLQVKVENGTVTGTDAASWAAFAPAETVDVAYDADARPHKSTLSGGGSALSVSQTSYDAEGRVDCTVVRMDPASFGSLPASACTPTSAGSNGPDRISKSSYDAAGRLIKVESGIGTVDAGNDAIATYTGNGAVASITDGEGNRTENFYDGHDRLAKTQFPSVTVGANASNAGDYEQLAYDANGNITQRRLRDGQLINYTLDNLNRVTAKDLPGSEPDASFTYDLFGQTLTATQNGQTLTMGYDALGRMTSMAGPLGTNSYGYDTADRRTSLTYPGATALTVNYDYDVTGNVTAIRENGATSGAAVLGTYAYDNLGRQTSLTRGNGTVTSFSYDPVSRLTGFAHDLAGTTHDGLWGQVFGVNPSFGYTASSGTPFAYNPAGQLTEVVRFNDAYAWGGHYNISRLYSVNGLNQLTAAGATTLGYDARGNLTSSGSSSYGYTSENLLKTAPNSVSLNYDPALRLYEVNATSGTTRFGYDGTDLIAEYNSSNTLLRRYVHGPGTDEPLVMYEGAGLTDRRWFHADERGSVIAVSTGGGAASSINAYDEYGIPASTNASIANGGRFQYTGQVWLPEVGIYYYKARMYSPTLGRFMQTDPIGYGDGINWYAYVGNDPVNATDPSGMTSVGGGPVKCPQTDPIHVCGNRSPPCPQKVNGVCSNNSVYSDLLIDRGNTLRNAPIVVTGARKTKRKKPVFGHDYETDNAICDTSRQSCNTSLFDSEVCVLPGSTGTERVQSGGRYLVGARIPIAGAGGAGHAFIPGGYVTSRNIGQNIWQNTTTPLHAFQGTITRAFYLSGSTWRVRTFGTGFAGTDNVGQIRDGANQVSGPMLFNAQDAACGAAVRG